MVGVERLNGLGVTALISRRCHGKPEALECCYKLSSIPSVRSPHTETVMQHCVRNYNTHDLRALLSSERRIGFARDTSGSHALKDALLLEKRASAVLYSKLPQMGVYL